MANDSRKPSGFNFLGSLSEIGTGLLSFGLNAAYNTRQAEKNREWQETMWQKQVAYNHPLQQRARLLAAGINPYSGLDSVPAGSVGPGAVASPANANLSAPLDASMKMASIAELLSRSEVNDAETGKKTAEIAELLVGVELGLINLEDARRMFEDKWKSYEEAGTSPGKQAIRASEAGIKADEAAARASDASASESVVHQGLMGEQYQLLQKQIEWYDKNQSAALAKIQSEVQNLDAATKRLLSANASQELLNERLDFQNAANDWFGFDVSQLPDATKTQVYAAYRDMLVGAKSPEDTIKFVASILAKAGTHERSVLQSWSRGYKFFAVSTDASGQYNSNR